MRLAVLLLGLIGSVAAGTLAVWWYVDMNTPEGHLLEALRQRAHLLDARAVQELHAWDRHVIAIWFLFAGIPLGVAGAILGYKGRGFLAAALMFLAVLGPAILDVRSLIFTFILIVSGILCLFVKSSQVDSVDADECDEWNRHKQRDQRS